MNVFIIFQDSFTVVSSSFLEIGGCGFTDCLKSSNDLSKTFARKYSHLQIQIIHHYLQPDQAIKKDLRICEIPSP